MYNLVTKRPHSYLLLDLSQSCPSALRYRTSIFEEDYYCIVFAPIDDEVKATKIGETEAYLAYA